jgi:biopolymer transport protein ExbB/TolQ
LESLKELFFEVSGLLLYPCLLLLVLFSGWTLMSLGSFAREALSRRRGARHVESLFDEVARLESAGPPKAALLPRAWRRYVETLRDGARDPLRVEKHLLDLETDLSRVVERSSLLSKIGPMLGLAGTLIPLGPALRAMADGSVRELSENLIVAFAATVVGLAIAGPSYWIATVRRRWYEKDLADMDNLWRRMPAGAAPAEAAA